MSPAERRANEELRQIDNRVREIAREALSAPWSKTPPELKAEFKRLEREREFVAAFAFGASQGGK